MEALRYMQHLFIESGFNACTYLLALQLLIPLEFSGSLERCMKFAGAAFLMAGKMNETVKASMKFVLEWSKMILNREDIINAEWQILNGFNFTMPINH